MFCGKINRYLGISTTPLNHENAILPKGYTFWQNRTKNKMRFINMVGVYKFKVRLVNLENTKDN